MWMRPLGTWVALAALGKGGLSLGGLFQPKPLRDSMTATHPPAQDCCCFLQNPHFPHPKAGRSSEGSAGVAAQVSVPAPRARPAGCHPSAGNICVRNGTTDGTSAGPASRSCTCQEPKGPLHPSGKGRVRTEPSSSHRGTENKVTNPLLLSCRNPHAKQHLITFKS